VNNVQTWLAATDDLPRRDRDILLEDFTTLSRAHLLSHPEQALTPAQQQRLAAATEELRAGKPLAYILGNQAFWDFTLTVSPEVLIPRPETELLAEWAIEHTPEHGCLLDLGTGSGAIAIAIARARPDLQVDAYDISAPALRVAKDNAQRLAPQVNFEQHTWLRGCQQRWHAIVSNPPYIDPADPHLTSLAHEPQSALVAANHGMADIEEIIQHAPACLNIGGWLALEHGYDQAERTRTALEASGFEEIVSHKDLAGIERISCGRWFAPHENAVSH